MDRRRQWTISNTAVLKEPDRQKTRELLPVLAIILGLLIPFLLYIWEGIEVVRFGYRIEALKSLRSDLVDQKQALEIEKARLLSVGRIERIARTKLGLRYPTEEQVRVVTVKDGRLVDAGGRRGAERREQGAP